MLVGGVGVGVEGCLAVGMVGGRAGGMVMLGWMGGGGCQGASG